MNQLLLEVAKRHGTMLGKDDPIFMTVTLNELVLASYLAQAGAAAEKWEARGAELMAQQVATVKSDAERIILGATVFFADQVKVAAKEIENSIRSAAKEHVDAAQAAATLADSARRTTLWAAAAAAGAAILSIGIGLGAMLK